jgi:FixJ family two-component response regulator
MFTFMLDQGKPTLVAIVDDDESMRAALQGLVQDAGLPTCIFECAGHQRDTACLIADIRMPGMSGLELQSRLNAEHQKIPIIFITAHGDEEMRFQALRAGAVEFLPKPFDDEILLDFVRAALSR